MSASNEQIRAAVAEQAADWFVENRGGPLADEARGAFVDWLKSSPMHVEEYLQVALLARDLAAAADDPEVALESLLSEARAEADNVVTFDRGTPVAAPVTARSRARRVWPLAAAAATAIVGLASTALWSARDGERFGLPRTYSAAHGEQIVRQLPDGSVLHLNTDSEVTVRFSQHERLIELGSGQALFEVAHDGGRQFRVAAGVAGVVAVGTRFDVYRRSGAVTVTVVEGVVAVYCDPQPPRSTSVPTPAGLPLEAGYQIDVGDRLGTPRRVDAAAAVAWLKRQIAFENRPLGEVAAEFNRYGRTILEIEDPPLRALPISGVFDAYDIDSFAAFLDTLTGVVVQKTPTRIRVRSLSRDNREPLSVAR